LDTACSLAQLQEEALGVMQRPYRRPDGANGQRQAWQGTLTLPNNNKTCYMIIL
jgi:hypothetical protein